MRAPYNESVFADIEQRKRSSAPVSISFASLACETRFYFIYLLGPFRIWKTNKRVTKSEYFSKWNLRFHMKAMNADKIECEPFIDILKCGMHSPWLLDHKKRLNRFGSMRECTVHGLCGSQKMHMLIGLHQKRLWLRAHTNLCAHVPHLHVDRSLTNSSWAVLNCIITNRDRDVPFEQNAQTVNSMSVVWCLLPSPAASISLAVRIRSVPVRTHCLVTDSDSLRVQRNE